MPHTNLSFPSDGPIALKPGVLARLVTKASEPVCAERLVIPSVIAGYVEVHEFRIDDEVIFTTGAGLAFGAEEPPSGRLFTEFALDESSRALFGNRVRAGLVFSLLVRNASTTETINFLASLRGHVGDRPPYDETEKSVYVAAYAIAFVRFWDIAPCITHERRAEIAHVIARHAADEWKAFPKDRV